MTESGYTRVHSDSTPRSAGVLGAGIMGGGIAYSSALNGIPILMKDICAAQLEVGSQEIMKLFNRQVDSKKLEHEKADALRASISPQLDYEGFDGIDIAIEAVVEKLSIKHKLLAELEGVVRPGTVIATNTSSLKIDDLATVLKRPQNFIGMHFFNPVALMPLVEVIRGRQTSAHAIATVVSYACALGKTPIVVKDAPGFLVNRLLVAYLLAFSQIVQEGADIQQVDAAMEGFGWPMGPAYLADVIGLDTMSRITEVVARGFPNRLTGVANDPVKTLAVCGHMGQKSGMGFYKYEKDAKGKPVKMPSQETHDLLTKTQPAQRPQFADAAIVERLMLAMIIEAAVALEEGVAVSAEELDLAMSLGLGFPKHAGGPLKYADSLGLATVVSASERLAPLGPIYRVSERMKEMAAEGASYYGKA